MKLTPDFLRTVAPDPGKRLEFRDDDEPGLIFRVTSTGSKSWSVRYVAITGEHRRKTFQYPDTGLARARVLARQLKGQTSEKRDVVGEQIKAKEQAERDKLDNFDKLAERYFEACKTGTHRAGNKVKPKGARTIEEEQRVYKADISLKFGTTSVRLISKRDIANHVDKLTQRSPSAGRHVATLMRQLLNFAKLKGLTTENVAVELAFKVPEARDRVLSDAELKAILAFLHDIEAREAVQMGTEMALLLEFMLYVPMRVSCVAGMRWDELDEDRGVWEIPASRMKNGLPFIAPLPPAAFRLLQRAKQVIGHETLVFVSRRNVNEPMHGVSIAHAFRRMVEKLGIERATPHDYRRAFVTGSVRLGLGHRSVVKLCIGHVDDDRSAGKVYDRHDYLAEKTAIAGGWAVHVERLSRADEHRPMA